MMKVANAMYDPKKAVVKGAKGAAATTVSGAVVTLLVVGAEIASSGTADGALLQMGGGAILTLLGAAGTGIVEWWRNRRKHKTKTYNPPYGARRAVLVMLSLGLGMGVLAGCVRTEFPDGRVVTTLDPGALHAAAEVYFAVTAELDRLEAEGERADAAEEADRQARMRALREQLTPLVEGLVERGADWLQREDGAWVSVKTGRVVNLE